VRTAFIKELFELAKQDERIVLIVGDLGFGVVTPFMEQLPRQFLNAGVAEQNMTGMAAGMALSGKIALTYSIANFPTMRCLEQVRNDVCYHNANVKVVSVGGGFTYGAMGATHHALEDLAVMRAMPGLIVVAPGDPVEARAATRAVIAYSGPCYLTWQGRRASRASISDRFQAWQGDSNARGKGRHADFHGRNPSKCRTGGRAFGKGRNRDARVKHAHAEAVGRRSSVGGGPRDWGNLHD